MITLSEGPVLSYKQKDFIKDTAYMCAVRKFSIKFAKELFYNQIMSPFWASIKTNAKQRRQYKMRQNYLQQHTLI